MTREMDPSGVLQWIEEKIGRSEKQSCLCVFCSELVLQHTIERS